MPALVHAGGRWGHGSNRVTLFCLFTSFWGRAPTVAFSYHSYHSYRHRIWRV